MKPTIANTHRLETVYLAALIGAEPAVAVQINEPKHGVVPTRSRPQLKRLGSLISFGGSTIAGMSMLCVSALLILLICGQPKLSAEENGITLHYTSGGSAAAIAAGGFNLADVQYVEQLNALPPGMKGLVWLDEKTGVTARFIAKVKPFIGNPKLFGFRLCDEPDITGKYHSPPVSPAALKAEADWIKANVPGAVTFITLMDMGSFEAPHFMNTFNPATTGIDFFGLNPYPVRGKVFDLDFIDRTVEAAVAAGVPLDKIVPVFQAFGGGNWTTYTDGARDVYQLPTLDQANQMFARWATYSPNPVFDFAYAWGSQNGDTKLGSTSPGALNLRAAFKAHNTAK
ncbi:MULTISPECIES: hypothetical protein [unclassified Mesorhizobium]|uniref:hypothetical protein n=1 Tax=unclassified Mesorhizobium TaxID=325217 RepID=UPI001FDF2742|nr:MULTISPECIES: hypothetical protein [unclassified Mesorhizobium]